MTARRMCDPDPDTNFFTLTRLDIREHAFSHMLGQADADCVPVAFTENEVEIHPFFDPVEDWVNNNPTTGYHRRTNNRWDS